ncbi:MAG: hypothetical protein FJW96_14415, partial [Actinobacteria bacterium]|nr:hypothetical protein [Actinomycetota bacterium]
MSRASHALGRHLAVAGFMGAGKTTVGTAVAERIGRRFVDLDVEIERRAATSIPDLFGEHGEAGFRRLEEQIAHEVLAAGEPLVVALGGGAVLSEQTRGELAARAFTVLLEIDADTAWERVRRSSRPLAGDRDAFHALHRERQPVYDAV